VGPGGHKIWCDIYVTPTTYCVKKKTTQIKKVIHSDIYATYMWWVGPQRAQDMSTKK